jgi:hypothetical protein
LGKSAPQNSIYSLKKEFFVISRERANKPGVHRLWAFCHFTGLKPPVQYIEALRAGKRVGFIRLPCSDAGFRRAETQVDKIQLAAMLFALYLTITICLVKRENHGV